MLRDPSSGELFEADIALNGVTYTWTTAATDGYSSASGPVDVQSIATHEIGHLIGLEHVTAITSTLFVDAYQGDTSWRALAQDEVSAAQFIYPCAAAPPESSISGRVTRMGGAGVARAIVVAFQNSNPVVGTMADAAGSYTIHRVPPGTYLVRVQPYSHSPIVTRSAFYMNAANVDVEFRSVFYPGASRENNATPVTVSAGTNTPNINVTVSASGNTPDPFEEDDTFGAAQVIAVGGQAHLKHSWPAFELDWVTFSATAGRVYVIETRNLGLQRNDNSGVEDSATAIELFDQTGSGSLGKSTSANDLERNNGSRVVRNETTSATRYVSVRQRTFANIGAGVYYDLRVKELAGPFSAPVPSSVTPAEATEDGGVVVTVHGTQFIPGAEVTFGGGPGEQEDVQGCDATLTNCTAIKVLVPPHAPGSVNVAVTNPDGQMASLVSGFTYVERRVGEYDSGTAQAFGVSIGNGTVACWGDFDGDGDQDLYNPYRESPSPIEGELWRNQGGGTFEDITASAGLDTSANTNRASCAWGDYDDDEDLDLYVVYGGNNAMNRLWRNNGNSTFTNVASTEGVTGGSPPKVDAAWSDFDLDGDLDLYLAYGTSAGTNQLFRNTPGATPRFADVAASANVNRVGVPGRALWADYDRDWHPDLYLLRRSGQQDVLFHNNGNGTFTDATAAAGIVEGPNCFDAAWGDFNSDDLVDLLCVGDSLPGSQPQRLWISQGNGTFVDRALAAGLNGLGRHATAVTVLDKDNDGDLDAYLGCSAFTGFPNAIFDVLLENGLNPPAFTNVSTSAGTDESAVPRDASAAACADFNGDSHADVLVVGTASFLDDDDFLWRNASNTNRALAVRLRGTLSNSLGLGAAVTVISDLGATPTEASCRAGSGIRQEVLGGSLSQNSMELEFGLGERPIAERVVDCVDVVWPRSRLRQTFRTVAVDHTLIITETADGAVATRVIPASGSTAGGNNVTILGFNLNGATQVLFGGSPAANVTILDGNTITCTTPAGAAGSVDVQIDTGLALVDGYAYIAPGSDITLTLDKDPAANAVLLMWTDVGQERYQVRRALGPFPSDFEASFGTSMARTEYVDTGILTNGINYYYLIPGGVCGNAALDPTEDCEGSNLSESCQSLGFSGGALFCTSACTFNVTACSP